MAASPGRYLLATLALLDRIVFSILRKTVPYLVLLVVLSVATAGPVAAGGGNASGQSAKRLTVAVIGDVP
jgi:hypothetical protein